MIRSEYNLATGEFTNRAFDSVDQDYFVAVLAEGCGWRDGLFNPDLHRVDLGTGEVLMPSVEGALRYQQRPVGLGSYLWNRTTLQWDDVRSLDEAKMQRRAAIKAEGVALIRARFPAIRDLDEILLVRQILLSVLPAARALTADMQYAAAVYDAGLAAIAAVNAAATVTEADAVAATWPPP